MSSAQSDNNNKFDLVIAGGGMTGAMLALQISRQLPQLRIAIIEQQAAEQQGACQQSAESTAQHTTSFDSRSIALIRWQRGFAGTMGDLAGS
ncbi:MAG: hypothetical protein U5L02_11300 [Rheinheimera sp.]|nr:hypothetical protein [Rheinheimera sp.]